MENIFLLDYMIVNQFLKI